MGGHISSTENVGKNLRILIGKPERNHFEHLSVDVVNAINTEDAYCIHMAQRRIAVNIH